MRNTLAIIFFVISLVLYILGITTPFMSFTISFNLKEMIDVPFLGSLLGDAMSEKTTKVITYTILDAISNLVKNNQVFVALLIGFFGVVVPALKTLLFLCLLMFRKKAWAHPLHRFINVMGKFAMADVFCIGVFIAFLYSKFQDQFLNVDIAAGYYYFVGYCLVSIVGTMLVRLPPPELKNS